MVFHWTGVYIMNTNIKYGAEEPIQLGGSWDIPPENFTKLKLLVRLPQFSAHKFNVSIKLDDNASFTLPKNLK